MSDSIRISDVVAATAESVFEAWLSSASHSAFTGTGCVIEASVYGRHSEGDGYIEGVTLEMDRGRRIVQTWRSTDFPAGAPDSQLELLLEPAPGGTRVTFVHTDIPEGQGAMYADGWRRYYLEPMKTYFAASPKAKAQPAPTAKKKAAPTKKAAPKKRAAPKKQTAPKKKANTKTKKKANTKAKPSAKKKAPAKRPSSRAKRRPARAKK